MNTGPQLPDDPTEFTYIVTVTAQVDFTFDVEVQAEGKLEAREKAFQYAEGASYGIEGYARSMCGAEVVDVYIEDVTSDDAHALDVE